MDALLTRQLENRMRAALESDDPKAYRRALFDVQIAQMQCQTKTALRVKTLERFVSDFTQQAKGARWGLRLAAGLLAAGGGAAALKLIQALF